MVRLTIAILTTIAIFFLVNNLLKGNKGNSFLKLLRDFLVVILALGLTVLVVFITLRLLRGIF
tara:strand:- start:8825 stop:9013 length:189 start_codon:yes stop_codon:yes gene_type:complete